MIADYQLRLLPQEARNRQALADAVARHKGISRSAITHVEPLRKSIDGRSRQPMVNLSVRVYVGEQPPALPYQPVVYRDVSRSPQAIVVGAGPAGLFAALHLIENGIRPVVVERGKDVDARKRDITALYRSRTVDPESNYCFGEGGAGAFSDGKLYTRSNKRGDTHKILRILCQHGATTVILSDAHPHIGSDKLPQIIKNIRQTIVSCGGEVHFSTRMTRLLLEGDSVSGIEARQLLTGETTVFTGPVILATGHSARDVYQYLSDNRIEMQPKGIAVGVRIEHPSALIDTLQYHLRHPRSIGLPPAEYSFATQVDGRGVYSFCMCPGGVVIPATTEEHLGVVNGMSASARASQWSNAGIVVEVRTDDVPGTHPLKMLHYQEQLERLTRNLAAQTLQAPAQRMADFVAGKPSHSLPKSSYLPGLAPTPLHEALPRFVGDRLRLGLRHFGSVRRGYLTNEATIIASETRTSAPVQILRDKEELFHVRLRRLYPCGEGAGYAGGIVSAAIDGERCAEKLAKNTVFATI